MLFGVSGGAPLRDRESTTLRTNGPFTPQDRETGLLAGTEPGRGRPGPLAWRLGPELRGAARGTLRRVGRRATRGHGSRRSSGHHGTASPRQGTRGSSERSAPHLSGSQDSSDERFLRGLETDLFGGTASVSKGCQPARPSGRGRAMVGVGTRGCTLFASAGGGRHGITGFGRLRRRAGR
jgi:hypothetical protein